MKNTMVALILLLALSACAHPAQTGAGDDERALAEAGHRVAQLKCARCHAIEPTGESRNPNAPPFRRVSQSVTIMTSETTLSEGIRIGHIDMPPVRLTRPEIEALSAYLRSLRS